MSSSRDHDHSITAVTSGQSARITVDEHPSLGLQISIESDDHGFRIKGPKYAGTSRRLLTAELDDRARREIAAYIGYGGLLDALKRIADPAPGVKRLPPWAVGIARAAIATADPLSSAKPALGDSSRDEPIPPIAAATGEAP